MRLMLNLILSLSSKIFKTVFRNGYLGLRTFVNPRVYDPMAHSTIVKVKHAAVEKQTTKGFSARVMGLPTHSHADTNEII